jgi:probable phosphoglycerate mutase
MTELILIRHGQTHLNRGPFFQGQIDVPLNELGLAQADRLAARLAGEHIDVLLCSDLLRTRQTADPASQRLALPATAQAALREQHFGLFEGLSFDEVDERYPQAWRGWLRHDPAYEVPGGESVMRFHERVTGALREIARTHAGRRIAVVTHGGVLDMVWRTARGLPLQGARACAIPNAGLNRLRVEGDAFEVLAWADDAHVADLEAAHWPADSASTVVSAIAGRASGTVSARRSAISPATGEP